ncbi:MAG: tripartite tricarboxylate transporter TctB family protein [Rhizobiaceae bacterium]
MAEPGSRSTNLTMRGGEIIVALILLAFCVAAWIISDSFKPETAMVRTLSPAFFPRVLIVGISLCAIFLLAKNLINPVSSQMNWGLWYKIPIVTVVMFLQVFLFELIGALPSAWICLVLLLLITGVRLTTSLIVACGFLIFVYIFFILILRVPLPMELFPTLRS